MQEYKTKFPREIIYVDMTLILFVETIIFISNRTLQIESMVLAGIFILMLSLFNLWKLNFFIATEFSLIILKKYKFPFRRKFQYNYSDIDYVYVNNSARGKFRSDYFTVFFKNKPKEVFTYDISTEEILLFVEKLKEKGVTVSLCKGFVYDPPKKITYKRRQKAPASHNQSK